jgi:hypothetical protein
VFGEGVEVVIEELLAEVGREVGFAVVEERGDVVLECAAAAALVVDEPWLQRKTGAGTAFAEHDVS